MGDAGPLIPDLDLVSAGGAREGENGLHVPRPPLKEVKILVTGFGPFKAFTINPSWLTAAALPSELLPLPKSDQLSSSEFVNPATHVSESESSISPFQKYKIKIILHQSPIRVSYCTASTIIPQLIKQHDPDYILHIGMAAGREHYTLETVAHRDSYKIKDVDDRDGWKDGEFSWKKEGLPEKLHVGWDAEDVLRRWEATLKRIQMEEHSNGEIGKLQKEGLPETIPAVQDDVNIASGNVINPEPSSTGQDTGSFLSRLEANMKTLREQQEKNDRIVDALQRGRVTETLVKIPTKNPSVKLSRDAGRYLCEFALFESLSRRWLDVQADQQASDEDDIDVNTKAKARERLGKVAFLHVPGGYTPEDIRRGAQAAEAAIRALVESWESGHRRKDGQESLAVGGARGWEGVVWKG